MSRNLTILLMLIGTITLVGCPAAETSDGAGSQTNQSGDVLILDDTGQPRVIINEDFNQVTED